MEFTFGAVFGAALGMAARKAQPRIEANDLPAVGASWPVGTLVGGLIVAGVFLGWLGYLQPLEANWQSEALGDPRRAIARVLLGFTGLGSVVLLLSRRWSIVAWQVDISVTIVAAAIDWQRDLLPAGGIELAAHYRALFVVAVAALSVLFVALWQASKSARLTRLTLFTICALMGFGYLMGLSTSDLWWPQTDGVTAAGGRAAYLWQQHRSEILVHAIFTTLFIVSVAGILQIKSSNHSIGRS
jgi:hypothetical protein